MLQAKCCSLVMHLEFAILCECIKLSHVCSIDMCFKFTPSVQALSYIILINAGYASETSQNHSLYILKVVLGTTNIF